MKKTAIFLCIMLCFSLFAGCSKAGKKNTAEEEIILNIAYQYGLAYAPAVICQEEGFIEKAYLDTTGKKVTVQWHQMSSGADINTGIASGSIDAGFMGIAPAITGITKKVGYKIFTNLSGQRHGIMTNDPSLNSIADLIGSSKQIALVNIGSFQHLILAKALADNGYDANSLDSNIVIMKHPDGKTALESGNVSCHLTTSPYIYKEFDNPSLHELPEVNNTWGSDSSFIIGVASESIFNENQALYNALCSGIERGIDEINTSIETAAAITSKYDGNSLEEEISYLKKGKYSVQTKDLLSLAQFMSSNGFVATQINSYSELVFDNVKGD